MTNKNKLTDIEKATYEWQMWVPDFGEVGQEKLKASTVLISRCGGLGSLVAYELAAAGVGKIIIAHGGNVKHSDLHRQLLMTYDWVGKPRIESITRRLGELNPHIEIIGHGQNINDDNAAELVGQADVVVDCAPLYKERHLMNREVVRQKKILVECGMFDLSAQITTIKPGKTPCLACFVPLDPPTWKRQFPVFGAVSGTVGCMGALEAIKVLAGFGDPLYGRLLTMDLRKMTNELRVIKRNPHCPVCSECEES